MKRFSVYQHVSPNGLNGIPLKWEFIVREVQDTTNYNKKADIEKGGN